MVATSYFSDFYPPADSGVEGSTVPTPLPTLKAPTQYTIYASYDGTIQEGQLPATLHAFRKQGEVDVSSQTEWSIVPSNCQATIDTTGTITITTVAQTGQISVSSKYKNSVLTATIQIIKTVGAPPTGNSDSTVVTGSNFPSTSQDTYAAYEPSVLKINTQGSTSVRANASVSINVNVNIAGTYGAFGKWQYRKAGDTTWLDVGPEVAEEYGASVVKETEDNSAEETIRPEPY